MLQKPDLPDVKIAGLEPSCLMPSCVLGMDGEEYEVLWHAAILTSTLPGLSAEVGVREGGASELILRTVDQYAVTSGGRRTTHVAIDPYGNIPYADRDGRVVPGFGYDEKMRRNAQASLSTIARSLDTDLLFMPMEDEEFFLRFEHGVPVYGGGEKRVENQYRLAHIDGPHTYIAAVSAGEFFANRLVAGGVLVFDNINYYDHGKVHEVLSSLHDMELLHVGESKALHRKVGP
jgi:hypothetical protein